MPRPRRRFRTTAALVAFVAGLLALAAPSAAHAHRMSLAFVRGDVAADGSVTLAVQLSSRDLAEVLELDRDRDATDDEIRGGAAKLLAYAEARLTVTRGEVPCPLARGPVDVVTQTDRFARLVVTARCPAATATTSGPLTLTYGLFFELDPEHTALVELHDGARLQRAELTRNRARLAWSEADARASLDLAGFVRSGVHHIFTGFDHLAFLLGLLVVVVLAPSDASSPARQVPRPLRAALADVVATVTAFTVAHSLTLVVAALGWLRLPSALVESAIAASIVYVAAENLVRKCHQRRYRLAFGFGLIHGVGFASMLTPLLPPSGVLMPLVGFNLGVELGQLAVVAAVLPLLALGARHRAYPAIAVRGGSLVLGALGLLWLIERVFDVTLLGL